MGWLGDLWNKGMFEDEELHLKECSFYINYYTAEGTVVFDYGVPGLKFDTFYNTWHCALKDQIPVAMKKKLNALCKKKLKEYTSKNKIIDWDDNGKIMTGKYVVKTSWALTTKDKRRATFDEWKKWKYGKK